MVSRLFPYLFMHPQPPNPYAHLLPCRAGIDIYFENVGGEHLSAALDAMRDHGRVVACGMISQYNLPPDQAYPITNLGQMITKRITIHGFVVTDPEMMRYMPEHQKNVTQWLNDGSMVAKTHEDVGMEKAADACIGVFDGKNFGKAVLKIKVRSGLANF